LKNKYVLYKDNLRIEVHATRSYKEHLYEYDVAYLIKTQRGLQVRHGYIPSTKDSIVAVLADVVKKGIIIKEELEG
jgi:hypothetical protein